MIEDHSHGASEYLDGGAQVSDSLSKWRERERKELAFVDIALNHYAQDSLVTFGNLFTHSCGNF